MVFTRYSMQRSYSLLGVCSVSIDGHCWGAALQHRGRMLFGRMFSRKEVLTKASPSLDVHELTERKELRLFTIL